MLDVAYRFTVNILNAFHYPVAHAAAHYYPNYEDEIAHFLRMIIRHCQHDALVADPGCGKASFAIPPDEFCDRVIGVDVSTQITKNR